MPRLPHWLVVFAMASGPGSGSASPALELVARTASSSSSSGSASGSAPSSSRSGRALDLRLGETAEIEPRLGGRPLPAGATVRWLEIVPRPEHVTLPAPSPPYRTYANAQLGGPRHGRWIGQDVIEGDVVALEAHGPSLRVEARELGTRWLAAEVTLPNGRVVRSPDGVGRGGVDPRALRVSVRADDTFLGWLGSYFRVPYVFGSTPSQSESYRGIDCADVMVAAQRRASGASLTYVSVQGLERHANAASEPFEVRDGAVVDAEGATLTLRFGEDVRPGDLLAIDYADDPDGQLPRPWDHVAAVLADRGPNGEADGVLGADDLVRHMGLRGLVDEPLARHGHVRLRIWRWR